VAKVKAKAKVKKEQAKETAERQSKLEKDSLKDVKVVERNTKISDSDVSVKELKNVIADSLERLWEELNATKSFNGAEHMRMSAEEGALNITRSLVYGIGGQGPAVKIREDDSLTPKFCKEHK